MNAETAFDAEFGYQPTLGNFGLFIWDWTPMPFVTVKLSPSEIVIPEIRRKVGPITLFKTSWKRSYSAVERAEAFVMPWWLPLRTLGKATVPFGIRLKMGPSRSRIMLFCREAEQLLDSLSAYGVPIERSPKKPNFLFIGRK